LSKQAIELQYEKKQLTRSTLSGAYREDGPGIAASAIQKRICRYAVIARARRELAISRNIRDFLVANHTHCRFRVAGFHFVQPNPACHEHRLNPAPAKTGFLKGPDLFPNALYRKNI
jgi:hypothetical protein